MTNSHGTWGPDPSSESLRNRPIVKVLGADGGPVIEVNCDFPPYASAIQDRYHSNDRKWGRLLATITQAMAGDIATRTQRDQGEVLSAILSECVASITDPSRDYRID